MSQKISKKYSKNRPKKASWPIALLVGGGLLLIIGAIFAFSRSGGDKANIQVKGASSLKVDREEVDLGDVKLGTTVQADFKITNAGDQTLRFTKAPYIEVKEGC